MKFKVGQKVRVYRNRDFPEAGVGKDFVISSVLGNTAFSGDPEIGSWSFHNLKLVKPKLGRPRGSKNKKTLDTEFRQDHMHREVLRELQLLRHDLAAATKSKCRCNPGVKEFTGEW